MSDEIVEQQVRTTGLGWEVADGDRVLEVARQPGLPWSFSPSAAGALDQPVASQPVGSGDQVVCDMPECPPGTACVQVCPPEEPGAPPRPLDLPSRDEAEERAMIVLSAAGVDVAVASVRVDDLTTAWLVSADPEVGGLATVGAASTVRIGAGQTIEHAGGWLAVPERGNRYELIGSSEALRRLVDGQPRPLSGGREPAVRCLDCPEPQPVVVTVTGVRLGLELVPAYDVEHTWLVPAYLFETTGGGPGPTW